MIHLQDEGKKPKAAIKRKANDEVSKTAAVKSDLVTPQNKKPKKLAPTGETKKKVVKKKSTTEICETAAVKSDLVTSQNKKPSKPAAAEGPKKKVMKKKSTAEICERAAVKSDLVTSQNKKSKKPAAAEGPKKKVMKKKSTAESTGDMDTSQKPKPSGAEDKNCSDAEKDPEKIALERTLKFWEKKMKRRINREGKIRKKNKIEAIVSEHRALEYLKCWSENREKWKFQTNRQTWLLQHMYDTTKVSDDNFKVLLEYFEGMRGAARDTTLKKAEEIVRWEGQEEDEDTVAAEKKKQRAKQICERAAVNSDLVTAQNENPNKPAAAEGPKKKNTAESTGDMDTSQKPKPSDAEKDPEKIALERTLKFWEKEMKRRINREGKIREQNKIDAIVSEHRALEYLKCFSEKREKWRFEAKRETWLLQHMYSTKVSDDNFKVLLEYFEGMRGAARDATLKKAEEIVRWEGQEEDGDTVAAEKKKQRAKQICERAAVKSDLVTAQNENPNKPAAAEGPKKKVMKKKSTAESTGDMDTLQKPKPSDAEKDPEKIALERTLKFWEKEMKRRINREGKIRKKNKIDVIVSEHRALEYLKCFSENREKWRFEAKRQTWLLQHMYSTKMSDDNFKVLLGYFEELRGAARDATLKKAEEIVRWEVKEDGDIVAAEKKKQRAKQVVQSLQ